MKNSTEHTNATFAVDNALLRLSRKGFYATLVMALFPAQQAFAAAGRVEFAIGNAVALAADGTQRPLSKGTEISAGDIVKTTDGRAQLRFLDGGYISLQPNTEFKVEDYNYSGKADGSELGIFKLIKGGLRAITGSIGKANKQAYRMNTPVATIGIRGTEWLSQYDGEKLLVQVGSGAVFLENGAGNLVIYSGQTAVVNGLNASPEYSNDPLNVTANKQNPNQTFEDAKPAEDNLFVAGDVRDESGTNTSLVGLNDDIVLDAAYYLTQDTTAANLMQLANLNAEAKYTGIKNVNFSGVCGSGIGNAELDLFVNFAQLSVSSDIKVTFSSGTGTNIPSGSILTASLSGGMLQTGSGNLGNIPSMSTAVISFSNSGGTTTNGFYSASGSLGSKINQAQINFSVGITGTGIYDSQASGSVNLSGQIVTPSQ